MSFLKSLAKFDAELVPEEKNVLFYTWCPLKEVTLGDETFEYDAGVNYAVYPDYESAIKQFKDKKGLYYALRDNRFTVDLYMLDHQSRKSDLEAIYLDGEEVDVIPVYKVT